MIPNHPVDIFQRLLAQFTGKILAIVADHVNSEEFIDLIGQILVVRERVDKLPAVVGCNELANITHPIVAAVLFNVGSDCGLKKVSRGAIARG